MRKLNPGDYARIGGPDGRMPSVRPPWLHRGARRKVLRVIGAKHQGHCTYILAGRGGRGRAEGLVARGDEVRIADGPYPSQRGADGANRTQTADTGKSQRA